METVERYEILDAGDPEGLRFQIDAVVYNDEGRVATEHIASCFDRTRAGLVADALSQKRTTKMLADICREHAEQKREAHGDMFATEKEMEMYRRDPLEMFTHFDVVEILAKWIDEHALDVEGIVLSR